MTSNISPQRRIEARNLYRVTDTATITAHRLRKNGIPFDSYQYDKTGFTVTVNDHENVRVSAVTVVNLNNVYSTQYSSPGMVTTSSPFKVAEHVINVLNLRSR